MMQNNKDESYPFLEGDYLLAKMHGIKYSKFTVLQDHDWVEKNQKGSCHDQVMYELAEFRKAGLNPKADFIIQVGPDGQGYETHSFVYLNKDGKYIWFEHAWGAEKGIHIYNSYSAMKKDIIDRWKVPSGLKVVWGTFNDSKVKSGDDLQTVVDKCL